MAASEWYDHSTFPSTGSFGSSSAMRAELARIETGISAKLPDLAGNGSKLVAVNAGGTALEAISTTGTGNGVRATAPTLTSPVITGGTINNASVGATTPSTGTFTELTATGKTGLGRGAASNVSARSGGYTGAITYMGFMGDDEIKSDVTNAFYGYRSGPTTQAAVFTLSVLSHFEAQPAAFGAGSSVTNQYGFRAASGLTGATNNYGFKGDIAAGANRWNFYAEGTAANHFTGVTTFGAKFGYGTTAGVGGTVVQATNKSTGVTLNTPSGQITMNNAALAATTIVRFTVTNSAVEANDTVVVHRISGGTGGAYDCWADTVSAGSFIVNVKNETAGSLGEAIVLQFTLVRGATS